MRQIRSTHDVALVAAALMVTVLASPSAQAAAESGTAPAKALIERVLRAGSGPLVPEMSPASLDQLGSRPAAKDLLSWARLDRLDIPQTPYSLYRTFQKTGAREPYEGPYFRKRELLTRAVLDARLSADQRYLDWVSDLVWSVCEETTWVLPAHETVAVDLFASETAADLGYVALVLADRLPKEVLARIRSEVNRRVLAVYQKDPEAFWWKDGSNNWTGVCAGSIGEAVLLLEPDVSRQAVLLEPILRQLDRFIEQAFSEDGASLEGIGYWNYGLTHYVALAEMLRSRTAGQIDLLANPKLKAIAGFPLIAALDAGRFISFADAHEESHLSPYLAARLGEREGQSSLTSLAGSVDDRWLGSALRNVLWWDGQTPAFQVKEAFLPKAGIVKKVSTWGGRTAVLVAKAGHNAEPHNNNDIASFILFVDGQTLLCDPGAGRYSKDYFGPARYNNLFASSLGHSVPVIGGEPQKEGRQHSGALDVEPDGTAVIRFEKAYDVADLRSAVRRLRLTSDSKVTLEDRFEFKGSGLAVKEAFMTWLAAEASGQTAKVKSPKGELTLEAPGATWLVERLEKESRENSKRETLTRLSAVYEAKPQIQAHVVMSYQPK
jgi:hypothetical protein